MEQIAVLRGNAPARIDDKGRLKIPTAFKAVVEAQHGRDVFVTSLTGESVRIYPMPVWIEIERRLAQIPSTHPARLRFFSRVNYYGQAADLDNQGRVLIHPRLRESAGMAGEVDVFGQYDHLEVWNHERFVTKLANDPYTDADARAEAAAREVAADLAALRAELATLEARLDESRPEESRLRQFVADALAASGPAPATAEHESVARGELDRLRAGFKRLAGMTLLGGAVLLVIALFALMRG